MFLVIIRARQNQEAQYRDWVGTDADDCDCIHKFEFQCHAFSHRLVKLKLFRVSRSIWAITCGIIILLLVWKSKLRFDLYSKAHFNEGKDFDGEEYPLVYVQKHSIC